jgi:hypothetical protein
MVLNSESLIPPSLRLFSTGHLLDIIILKYVEFVTCAGKDAPACIFNFPGLYARFFQLLDHRVGTVVSIIRLELYCFGPTSRVHQRKLNPSFPDHIM